jgi:general secretion pathway protein H
MVLMVSPGEPEPMRTLLTGKRGDLGHLTYQPSNQSEAGFTLIEFLVAMVVMATLLGIAVLTIPNHDERYWRDNLDQLVRSLNFAQEESAMSGTPMLAQVDSQGWRFTMNMSNRTSTQNSNIPSASFLPDVYRPQTWHKPVEIIPQQLSLGAEYIMPALAVPIKQEGRQAILQRDTRGRFQWIKP